MHQRWRGFSLLLTLITSIITPSLCLYKEDVGAIDWYKKQIGQVEQVFFRPDELIVSGNGVLASLHLRNGEISWRHTLDQKIRSVIQNLEHSDSILTISGENAIHFWNSKGGLVWDATTSQEILDATWRGKQILLLLPGGSVEVRSSTDGKVTKVLSGEQGHYSQIVSVGDRTFMFGVHNSQIEVRILNADSTIASDRTIDHTHALRSQFVVGSKDVVFQDETGALLAFNFLSTSTFNLNPINLNAQSLNPNLENTDGFSARQSLTEVTAFKIQDGKTVVLHRSESTNEVSVSPVSNHNGEDYVGFATVTHHEAKLHHGHLNSRVSMEIVNLKTGTVDRYTPIEISSESPLDKIFLHRFNKPDGSHGFHAVAMLKDLTFLMFSDVGMRWEREENLAYITQVEFLPLPAKISENLQDGGIFARIRHRFSSQISALTNWVPSISNSNSQVENFKDVFGFRQFILVSTFPGNSLQAISTVTGKTIWKRYFGEFSPSQFFVTRPCSHFPPKLLAVTTNQIRKSTQIFWLNPLDGQILEQHEFSWEFRHGVMTPDMDSHGNHAVALIDFNLKVHVFAETEESREIFAKKAKSFYFHVEDSRENSLKGYALQNQGSTDVYDSNLVWQIPFSSSEKIIASTHSPKEQINSAARIVAERKVLQKYLNKNLISVATEKFNLKSSWENSVNIHLIDSITGKILTTLQHKNSNGPVHMVQVENWVAYHLWNSKSHSFEMTLVELHHSDLDWNSETYSSYDRAQLNVSRQSYTFPMGIRALGATQTLRGITHKNVLVGLESGQVMTLSRAWIDSRRPSLSEVTQAEREEGVIPYDPNLQIFPRNFINYYQLISDLRGIQVGTTSLESTSVVLAYGRDLFFTRVAPSNTFDILNSDFNYSALVLTSVTLLVVTLASRHIAAKRDLNRQWR